MYTSNNSLTDIRDTVLPQTLKYSTLDGNKLQSIPETVTRLKNLRVLAVYNNLNIENIPLYINELSKITIFDIRNNSLTKIPNQFANFKNLKKAYLSGNPVGSNGWLDHANNAIVNLFEKDKIAKCEMQCSPFCTDDTQNYKKACIPSCNSHSCNFQNGACQVD